MIEQGMLIVGGIIIGIVGVLFGGSMFFSIPLVQVLFPEISFGAVIGNIKTGSFFRGLGSTISTRKKIDYKKGALISIPLIVGTILGVLLISKLDQSWVLPVIIVAVILAELAPRVAKYVTKEKFYALSVALGAYAGILGAGIGIFLIALLRTRFVKDSHIAHIKIQARFIEFLLVITAVIVHYLQNDLILSVWLPWSVGSIAGGIIGGMLLKKIQKLSGNIQKIILRISFALAIIIASINAFT